MMNDDKIPQIFPKDGAFRDEFLGMASAEGRRPGTRHACQVCEQRFILQEYRTDGVTKSKSWALGRCVWGNKDPQFVEVFLVKCPSCGQPSQLIIMSKRRRALEMFEAPTPTTTALLTVVKP